MSFGKAIKSQRPVLSSCKFHAKSAVIPASFQRPCRNYMPAKVLGRLFFPYRSRLISGVAPGVLWNPNRHWAILVKGLPLNKLRRVGFLERPVGFSEHEGDFGGEYLKQLPILQQALGFSGNVKADTPRKAGRPVALCRPDLSGLVSLVEALGASRDYFIRRRRM